jgi:hypothetical protein
MINGESAQNMAKTNTCVNKKKKIYDSQGNIFRVVYLSLIVLIILSLAVVMAEKNTTTLFDVYNGQKYQCSSSPYKNTTIYTNYPKLMCATQIIEVVDTCLPTCQSNATYYNTYEERILKINCDRCHKHMR